MQHGAAVELLARAPMFRGLGGELLTAILQRGDTHQFGAGQALAVAGEPAGECLFILEGNVTLLDPEGRELEHKLEPGMSLNDMAMFVETDHFFDAVAVDDVAVFKFQREAMGNLMVEQPYLAAHFASNIKHNLARTADTLRELDDTLARSTPEVPQFDDAPPATEVAVKAVPDIAAGAVESAASFMSNGSDGPVSNGASNDVLNDMASDLPVQDLLADLNAARGPADQTPPEQGRGLKVFSSPAPRRSREVRPQSFSEPGSPIYGPDAGHGWSPANYARGNSTR